MFRLKDNLELGVASSSMQIEGGEIDSNWHDWYRQGRIKDGTTPANANDHWNRYASDLAIMADLKISHYRFGIEWTRIEPEEGRFEPEALAHYRDKLERMRSLGIRPLLTLWHFSHPMWFARKGGFTKAENIEYFLRFVRKVVEELGDLVDEYITINEPNVWATHSYLFDLWPPSESKSVRKTIQVMSVLACAHIEAFQLIKQLNPAAKISLAHHVRVFTPKHWYDKPVTKFMKFAFQDSVTRMFLRGDFPFPFKNYRKLPKGEYADFIGVNYYSQTVVSGFSNGFSEDLPKNDLGWDILPEGLTQLCRELADYYPAPIYITENGTCDNDDRFRSRYIYEHIQAINDPDLPVERFYHWSFTDNFEWVEGETGRFGLVRIDYQTQERKIKDSGYFYRDLIENREITPEMDAKYLQDSQYDPVK